MCLACEQEGMWLAYLQRRGLITPDGRFVEPPPFLADANEPPVEPQPEQEKQSDSASELADKGKFSCDDSTAG